MSALDFFRRIVWPDEYRVVAPIVANTPAIETVNIDLSAHESSAALRFEIKKSSRRGDYEVWEPLGPTRWQHFGADGSLIAEGDGQSAYVSSHRSIEKARAEIGSRVVNRINGLRLDKNMRRIVASFEMEAA